MPSIKGIRVVIADDLLATGGTVSAVVKLVEGLGADLVECASWLNWIFLKVARSCRKGRFSACLTFRSLPGYPLFDYSGPVAQLDRATAS